MNKNAREIRKTILKMVYESGSSHVGSCFSIVDVLEYLYRSYLVYDVSNPQYECRDRLIMSKGHAAAALYATLAEFQFFNKSELKKYAGDDSIFMSHVSNKVPGIEFSTGSLGHGLPFGAGKALKLQRTKPTVKTIVILSDGELNEGSNWEAIMFAAHHKLGNLSMIIDANKLQSLDTTKNTLDLGDINKKFTEFGWDVIEFNGNSPSEIETAFRTLTSNRPKAFIAHTIKGSGVPFMENTVKWHYKSPDQEEYYKALECLNA